MTQTWDTTVSSQFKLVKIRSTVKASSNLHVKTVRRTLHGTEELKQATEDLGQHGKHTFSVSSHLIYLETDGTLFIRASMCVSFRFFLCIYQRLPLASKALLHCKGLIPLICAQQKHCPTGSLGCLHYAQNANINIKRPQGRMDIL